VYPELADVEIPLPADSDMVFSLDNSDFDGSADCEKGVIVDV